MQVGKFLKFLYLKEVFFFGLVVNESLMTSFIHRSVTELNDVLMISYTSLELESGVKFQKAAALLVSKTNFLSLGAE